jgi:hypothetical protein
MCNVCYLFVVSLYYCHRVKAQLQFNKYIYVKEMALPSWSILWRGKEKVVTPAFTDIYSFEPLNNGRL